MTPEPGHKPHETECPTCEGYGTITSDGWDKLPCLDCAGEGWVSCDAAEPPA